MNPKCIINFPTRRHWKEGSRMEDIRSGLVDLAKVIAHSHLRSMAIPPSGSGLDRLAGKKIGRALLPLPEVRAFVYEPWRPASSEATAISRPCL